MCTTHFLLYYGRDIPKMQNSAKTSKKRLRKIKEVTEDGKLGDGWILQTFSDLINSFLRLRCLHYIK